MRPEKSEYPPELRSYPKVAESTTVEKVLLEPSVGPNSTKLGQVWLDVDRCRPMCPNSRPTSSNAGTFVAGFGPHRPTSGKQRRFFSRDWSSFGQTRPEFGQLLANFARIRLVKLGLNRQIIGQTRPIWVELGPTHGSQSNLSATLGAPLRQLFSICTGHPRARALLIFVLHRSKFIG